MQLLWWNLSLADLSNAKIKKNHKIVLWSMKFGIKENRMNVFMSVHLSYIAWMNQQQFVRNVILPLHWRLSLLIFLLITQMKHPIKENVDVNKIIMYIMTASIFSHACIFIVYSLTLKLFNCWCTHNLSCIQSNWPWQSYS